MFHVLSTTWHGLGLVVTYHTPLIDSVFQDPTRTFLKKTFAANYHRTFTYKLQHYFSGYININQSKPGFVGWGVGVDKTEIKGKREKTIAAMQALYIYYN